MLLTTWLPQLSRIIIHPRSGELWAHWNSFRDSRKTSKLQPYATLSIWHWQFVWIIRRFLYQQNCQNLQWSWHIFFNSEWHLASQFLSEFRLVDEEVISGYENLCTTFCSLDPIPLSVFQRRRIVNLLLQGGQVPDRFKVGVIKPLFKKSGAHHENLSNFWSSALVVL